MKPLITIPFCKLFLLAALLGSSMLATEIQPEARKILELYNETTGGTEAKSNIQTIAYKGTWTMEKMEIQGPAQILIEEGKQFAMILEIPGVGKIRNVYSNGDAWIHSPYVGFQQAENSELEQLIRNTAIFPEIALEKHFEKISLTEIQNNGLQGVVLAHSTKTDETWFINEQTGLLEESRFVVDQGVQGSFSIVLRYSDYRAVDGVLQPFNIQWKTPVYEVEIVVEEIQMNVDLPTEPFERPADTGSQTPS